jgi:hypothetical protein
MQGKEQWEQLTGSYNSVFRLARTMEKGLPIITALEFLANDELFDIAHLLSNIADLWDDELEDEAKKTTGKNIRKLIAKLDESEHKDMIIAVFRHLSYVSESESMKTKPRTVNKSPRYSP